MNICKYMMICIYLYIYICIYYDFFHIYIYIYVLICMYSGPSSPGYQAPSRIAAMAWDAVTPPSKASNSCRSRNCSRARRKRRLKLQLYQELPRPFGFYVNSTVHQAQFTSPTRFLAGGAKAADQGGPTVALLHESSDGHRLCGQAQHGGRGNTS